jgi:hypothetical protein
VSVKCDGMNMSKGEKTNDQIHSMPTERPIFVGYKEFIVMEIKI